MKSGNMPLIEIIIYDKISNDSCLYVFYHVQY